MNRKYLTYFTWLSFALYLAYLLLTSYIRLLKFWEKDFEHYYYNITELDFLKRNGIRKWQ
ncbi:hypothetical protein DKB58_01745 [Capnocytophaga canimorsus]|nr:hypothetical protein DKB58_01745 [Capnocytophaga canimorsus]